MHSRRRSAFSRALALSFSASVALLFLAKVDRVGGQAPGPLQAAGAPEYPGQSASGPSTNPRLSADGRWLVFVSSADNLVTNAGNGPRSDVFIREIQSGVITLISVGQGGAAGNGSSGSPLISGDGRFVAFESTASNLVSGDTNAQRDVFRRDCLSGTTVLVSTGAVARSAHPVMTPDGRWIAFERTVDLVTDLMLRDMTSGVTLRVNDGLSVDPFNPRADAASLSDDGQRVAFARGNSLEAPTLRGSAREIYLRDFQGNTTSWVSGSVYSNRAGAMIRSSNPALSADGRYVAFKTAYWTGDRPVPSAFILYLHELDSGLTTLVSSNVLEMTPSVMTPDGRFLAYESENNVFLWDRLSGLRELVSVNTSGFLPAVGVSSHPRLTPNADRIVFLSDASDLTLEGGNGRTQIFLRDRAIAGTRLVSADSTGRPMGDLSGIYPDLAPDGSMLAFESDADSLVDDDNNGTTDVFIRYLDAGLTSLMSVRWPSASPRTSLNGVTLAENSLDAVGHSVLVSAPQGGVAAGTPRRLTHLFVHDFAAGISRPVDLVRTTNSSPAEMVTVGFSTNISARFGTMSGNGRVVAYVGRAAIGPGAVDRIFRRDLAAPAAEPLTGSVAATSVAGAVTSPPSLSWNGLRIAFETDLPESPGDANGVSDIYLRDLEHGTNVLISVNRGGARSGDGPSIQPVISRGGRWVVFKSRARDLTSGFVPSGTYELYVRDLLVGRTTQISESGDFGPHVRLASISPSGADVMFETEDDRAWLHNLATGVLTLICSNCQSVAMNADGRWIAYATTEQAPTNRQVFVKSIESGATELISANAISGPANGSSHHPVVTFDGRFVVFVSRATDLVDNDRNGSSDVFIRDRILQRTFLASVSRFDNDTFPGFSGRPVLGPDGRTVVFQSFAHGMVEGDFNNSSDVFRLQFGSGDSDGDNLDDDWELAYFGFLGRDGHEDFDGDGEIDEHEFRAGTDPTDEGSVFTVLVVSTIGEPPRLLWSTTPGRSYRVQFREHLDTGPWIDLPGSVTALGWTATRVDDSALGVARRFYRVQVED
jgi:Tol biopolymer transport system component